MEPGRPRLRGYLVPRRLSIRDQGAGCSVKGAQAWLTISMRPIVVAGMSAPRRGHVGPTRAAFGEGATAIHRSLSLQLNSIGSAISPARMLRCWAAATTRSSLLLPG